MFITAIKENLRNDYKYGVWFRSIKILWLKSMGKKNVKIWLSK